MNLLLRLVYSEVYTPSPREQVLKEEEEGKGILLLDRQNISGLQRPLAQEWVRLL